MTAPVRTFSLSELKSLTRLESPTPSVHADALEALVDVADAALATGQLTYEWKSMAHDAPFNRLARALKQFAEAQ